MGRDDECFGWQFWIAFSFLISDLGSIFEKNRHGEARRLFKKKIESEEILIECPPVRFEPTIPRMSAGRSTCVATVSLDEKWPHFAFYKLNMPLFKPLYAFVCLIL